MNAYMDTTDSPAGRVTFAVNEVGALIAVKFVEGEDGQSLGDELARAGFDVLEDRDRTDPVRRQLGEYYAGTRRTFDIPVALDGSPWQLKVWKALMEIPFGETRSYGEVAAMVGSPHAARAVGRANATNRIPLVVPCHRVIGADGRLTGFAGGVHLKDRLLAHELGVLSGAR